MGAAILLVLLTLWAYATWRAFVNTPTFEDLLDGEDEDD